MSPEQPNKALEASEKLDQIQAKLAEKAQADIEENTPEEETEVAHVLARGLRFRDWALHIALILLSLMLEGAMSLAFLDRMIPIEAAIATHGGVLVIQGLSVWLAYRRGYDMLFLIMLFLFTLGMGPFGPTICLLAFLLFARFSKESKSFAEWFAALFPDEEMDETEALFQRILSGRDDLSDKGGMMTFQDVFIVGTMAQKRLALTKIAQHFRKDFAPALRQALEDENNAIRVQAATVAARIEQGFVVDLVRLTNRYKARPEDPDVLLQLAQQTDNYAYSGILDGERLTEMVELTVFYYQEYLKLIPDDFKTRFVLGRLLLQTGKSEEALQHFWSCILEGGMDQLNVQVWLLQAFFQLGRFEEIHDYVHLYPMPEDKESLPASMRANFDLMEFWKEGMETENLKINTT